MDLRVEKRKLRDKYGDFENTTPAHVAVITTPKIKPLNPKMTPPRAHTTRGLFNGSGSANAEKPQEGDNTATSNGSATSSQPVTDEQPVTSALPDDIERRDFEEENRLLNLRNPADGIFKYACSRKSNITVSSENISFDNNHIDYSLPGCSKENNKTAKTNLPDKDYLAKLAQYALEHQLEPLDVAKIEALLKKGIEGWRILTEQALLRRQRYIEERQKEMLEDEKYQLYLQQKRRELEMIEIRQRIIEEETRKEEEALLRRKLYNQQKQREQEAIERRHYVEHPQRDQEAVQRRQRYIEHKQKEQEAFERRRYIEHTQRVYTEKMIMHQRNMGVRRQDVFDNNMFERLQHDQELEEDSNDYYSSDNYQSANNYQSSNNYQRSNDNQDFNNYQNSNNYRNLNNYPITNNDQNLNNYQSSYNYQRSSNYQNSNHYQSSNENDDMNVNDGREIIGMPVPLQEDIENTTEEDRGYHYHQMITVPYHNEIDETETNYDGDEENYATEYNDFDNEPLPLQVVIEEPVELSHQIPDNNDTIFVSHPIVETEVPSDPNSDNDVVTMPMSSSIKVERGIPADHSSDNNDVTLPISTSVKLEPENPIDQDSNSNLEQMFNDYDDIPMSHSANKKLNNSSNMEERDHAANQNSTANKKNSSKYNDDVIMPRPIGEKRKKPVDKVLNRVSENNAINGNNIIMPPHIGEKKKSATNQSLNNRIDESNSTKATNSIPMPPIKQEVDDLGDDVLENEENSSSDQENVRVEKEDFMQKLLNSNTSEKRVFPKGKLYRAEVMEGVDIDMSDSLDVHTTGPSGSAHSNVLNTESTSSDSLNIGSTSSSASNNGSPSSGSNQSTSATTSNADKLLGLDKKSKLSELTRSKTKTYGICPEDEAGEEHNDDSWCACLSSHEDDDDDDEEQEPEPEPERQLRKRRNDPPAPLAAKKFCPSDAHVAASAAEPRPVPGSSGVPPAASQDPPDLNQWLNRFATWSNSEKTQAIDALINRCAAGEVRHMMTAIEPLFQRDFISLLPKELALSVLGYLEPRDLLRAAQTCRYWRFLADDNLLWKEKCRRIGITTLKKIPRTLPRCASLWKAAYMRQHMIEHNWLHKSVKDPIVMRGHDDHVITCLQFSRNRILSGSDDTTLRVWSAVTGKCLRILVGHSGGVWSSQMVGHLVISGSTDRTLRVWNAKSGHCIKVLAGHTSTVRCMHLHDNRVVSGSRDATLRVWSLPDGRCLRVLVGHIAAVRCVQFDGKYVVSGAYDYFVKVWNPDSGECLHTLSGHTNRVYSLQFDGVHVVSGSLDTSIRVWEVKTGQLKHTLTGHQSLTSGMELNSNILVSGNADSTVKVWNIATGHCLHTLAGPNKHQSAVTCLQSSNRFVITSSDDGTVKLWDVRTGEFIRNLVELGSGGSGGVVWRIRASGTKLVCAVGSRNGTEETKLLVLNFDIPGACRRCNE